MFIKNSIVFRKMVVYKKSADREVAVEEFHKIIKEMKKDHGALYDSFNMNRVVLSYYQTSSETLAKYNRAKKLRTDDEQFPLPAEFNFGKSDGIPKVAGSETNFSRIYQFQYKTARVSKIIYSCGISAG